MLRKLLFVFLFFISIRVYAVAETAVFDDYLKHTEPEKMVQKIDSKIPTVAIIDTSRNNGVLVDTLTTEVHQDSLRKIPFFFFEQKVSTYKLWLKSLQVF